MLVWHRRFDDLRDATGSRSARLLEYAEQRALTGEEYVAGQTRRDGGRPALVRLARRAPARRDRRADPADRRAAARARATTRRSATSRISLTHYWDWTGFPVVALPSGVGRRSGLPTGVSLIGAPGADWDLLARRRAPGRARHSAP